MSGLLLTKTAIQKLWTEDYRTHKCIVLRRSLSQTRNGEHIIMPMYLARKDLYEDDKMHRYIATLIYTHFAANYGDYSLLCWYIACCKEYDKLLAREKIREAGATWEQLFAGEMMKHGATLEQLREMCSKVGYPNDDNIISRTFMVHAAAQGRLDLLQWMHLQKPTRFLELIEDMLREAARNNHPNILTYIYEQEQEPLDVHYEARQAFAHGRLEVFNILITRWTDGPVKNYRFESQLGYAARTNNHRVLEFAHEHRIDWGELPQEVIIEAVRGGHLNLIKWLFEIFSDPVTQVYRFDNDIIDEAKCVAASERRLEVMEWLQEKIPQSNLCYIDEWWTIAYDSHIDLGQCTLSTFVGQPDADALLPGKPNLNSMFESAIEKGQVFAAQCIYNEMDNFSGPMECNPIPRSIIAGNIEMISWLHEHTPRKIQETRINQAIMSGSLDMVRWVDENVIPRIHYSTSILQQAINFNNTDIQYWIHTHMDSNQKCAHAALDDMAAYGCSEKVRWLHEHCTSGFTTKAMDRAAERGHIEVVRFLDKYRTEGCTVAALDLAAGNGHITVVHYLYEHRNEGHTDKAIELAIINGHNDVVGFLRENNSKNRTLEIIKRNRGKKGKYRNLPSVDTFG